MIHVYCGDGKGKTTAAAGLAARAAGSGKTVVFAQFMKGGETGEVRTLGSLPEISVMRAENTEKFTYQMTAEERLAAEKGNSELLTDSFKRADELNADILILDEALAAVERGMIDETRLWEHVCRFGAQNNPDKELVLTGRMPFRRIIDIADYVTDMEKIRHPFDRGISARKGVEY